MNAESLLVSGLLVAMFGAGFAGGWYLARERMSASLSFTNWTAFGVRNRWVTQSSTPHLYAAYVEHMAEEFDALPKYDWPTKDRHQLWTGKPE
jgi:hypothetical protein